MSSTETDIQPFEELLRDLLHKATLTARTEGQQEAYEEILQGLVDIEAESRELTEEKSRKFARLYAIIAEVRDVIDKYRGLTEIPLEDLERFAKGAVTVAEVRTIFLMVRYADALRVLESHKPDLARALLGARGK